jgi:hypothetical protein
MNNETKAVYIKPEIEVYEMESEGIMTDTGSDSGDGNVPPDMDYEDW